MTKPTAQDVKEYLAALMTTIKTRDPDQTEFHQAVEEVFATLAPALSGLDRSYMEVLEQLVEPERLVQFRVVWTDDSGARRINRGWRVQMNSAIGPYKGGLRFRSNVNLSVLKFLAFEQCFKNALTTLPMGGGKGGSDFDPAGKSDREIMSFCQSFMTELYRYIGPDVDVPAGDIGVGGREIGFLFGQFKRITGQFVGTLTGKGHTFGGSLLRPEATGFGAVYFLSHMLEDKGFKVSGRRLVLSGSGNVAQFAAVKLIELGAQVVTLSDSAGHIYVPGGITEELMAKIMKAKNQDRARLSTLASEPGVEYAAGAKPWARAEEGSVVMPCATQNEISVEEGAALIAARVLAVAEGANMPTANAAITAFVDAGVLFGPAKAVNAGGVACSGLEMAQNAGHTYWSRDEVSQRLQDIMREIFSATKAAAADAGQPDNLPLGANTAAFMRLAEAMRAQGSV
jgi:glutamate dehydrogenase (NADP+)